MHTTFTNLPNQETQQGAANQNGLSHDATSRLLSRPQLPLDRVPPGIVDDEPMTCVSLSVCIMFAFEAPFLKIVQTFEHGGL